MIWNTSPRPGRIAGFDGLAPKIAGRWSFAQKNLNGEFLSTCQIGVENHDRLIAVSPLFYVQHIRFVTDGDAANIAGLVIVCPESLSRVMMSKNFDFVRSLSRDTKKVLPGRVGI